MRWSLKSLLTQTILGLCDFAIAVIVTCGKNKFVGQVVLDCRASADVPQQPWKVL